MSLGKRATWRSVTSSVCLKSFPRELSVMKAASMAPDRIRSGSSSSAISLWIDTRNSGQSAPNAARTWGEKSVAGRLKGADGDASDLTCGESVQIASTVLEAIERPVRVTEQRFAGGGERRRPGAGAPVDESVPDDPFHGSELLGHGALLEAKFVVGPTDGTRSGDRRKSRHVASVEAPGFSRMLRED